MASFNTSIDWLLNPEKRGRSKSYDEGEKLVSYVVNEKQAQGVVDVFTQPSYIRIARSYVPGFIYAIIPADFKKVDNRRMHFRKNLKRVVTAAVEPEDSSPYAFINYYKKMASWFRPENARNLASAQTDDAEYLQRPEEVGEMLKIGPIPAGVPVNLVSNMNLESNKIDVVFALKGLIDAINTTKNITDQAYAARVFMRMAGPGLLKISKCDDFIVNKGHYFGTGFSKLTQELSPEDKTALTEFLKHM